MRRLLLVFTLLSLCVFGFGASAIAQSYDPFGEVCEGNTSSSEVCQEDADNPVSGNEGVIAKVLAILSYVVGATAVVMVIYGGFKYITANGDANAVTSAKNTVLYALIGIVVFAFSQYILQFVINSV